MRGLASAVSHLLLLQDLMSMICGVNIAQGDTISLCFVSEWITLNVHPVSNVCNLQIMLQWAGWFAVIADVHPNAPAFSCLAHFSNTSASCDWQVSDCVYKTGVDLGHRAALRHSHSMLYCHSVSRLLLLLLLLRFRQ